jgi:glycosyltransferase involved in cell wall biosynthesis
MLVAPALRARPPIAMMQAIAAGVPACGTKCAAPPEIECIACEPNRSAMRDMLRTMLRHTAAQRRETALRLQEQARHRLSWPALIDRYIDLYGELSEPRT